MKLLNILRALSCSLALVGAASSANAADNAIHFVKTVKFHKTPDGEEIDRASVLRAAHWAKEHKERRVELLGFACAEDKKEGDTDREFLIRAEHRSDRILKMLTEEGIAKERISKDFGGFNDEACQVQVLMK